MTTMDSDSESQDSDEGRRFRFEATRKDAHVTQSAARRRKPSPFQPNRRPSREKSRERTRHDRSRSHNKDRRKDRDRHSRDRHGRSGSGSKEPVRSSKNSKEDRSRKDRDDRHRDHNHKSLHKDYDRRDSRSRDFKRDRRRSRDSYDRRSDKRDRSRRYSRERDRHKKSRDNERVVEANTGNGDKNSTHDDNDRISNLSNQDCKDLNLSDFDIVSDTEGNSQSDSSLRGRNWSRDSRDRKSRLRTRSRSRSRGKSRGSKSRSRSRSKLKASPIEIVGDEIVIDSIGNDNEEEEEEDDDDLEKFNTDILLHASTSVPSLDSVNDNDNLKICTDLIDNLSDDDDNKNYSNLNIDDIDEENHGENSGEVEVPSANCYGPTLPPEIVGNPAKSMSETKNSEVKIIGPCLPDGFKKIAQDEDEAFGPSLPPTLQRVGEEKKRIGPSLPRHLMEHLEDEDDYLMEVDVEGEPDELDEEEEILGPLPADHPAIGSDRIQRQLEYRARLIKEELAEIDYREEKKREEWMTELPAVRAANLGLGPRKFHTKEGPDFSDRSSWTDTPTDRERKQKELKMDKRPAEAIDDSPREKSSKRHEKSLLEMHQKKLNKKRRKDEKEAKKNQTTVRRPFDRDMDMQVNRFDDARKKSILMKAQKLDDRFSRGKM
ncbi:uncharacterized protein LOC141534667 [Cotesia typhae]|uniref:uncharacterized protein LOC141534667 n=1 Tax=Cotesia typhae TaxID=2053667 RepID=UPI003D6806E5